MDGQVTGSKIDRKALADLVIQRLKSHENPDDIIFEISNLTAWDWEVSRQFIEEVGNARRGELNSWEMWISLLVGGAFTLIGFSAICLPVMYFWNFDPLMDLVRDVNMVVGFSSVQGLLISLAAGLSMTVGGVIGIIKGLRMMGEGMES